MMQEKSKSGLLIAGVTLVIFLAVTLWLWQRSVASTMEVASQRFEFRNNDVVLNLRQRLEQYAHVLIATTAFFEGSPNITRDDWRQYVNDLQLEERFPGIQGIGFAKVISPAERETLVREMQAEGYADFSLWPAGNRPLYTAILYLEPLDWRNERALGYDMFSEPTRQKAMERARDSGDVSASGVVSLVQEVGVGRQPGFLMYYPVYTGRKTPTSIEHRRERLAGFIYSPFRVHDLIEGLLGQRSLPYRRMQIFSDDAEANETPIYDSEAGRASVNAHNPVFASDVVLDFYGESWTLRFTSLPSFEASSDIDEPRWILFGGIGFSFLMAVFIWVLWTNQRRGWALYHASSTLLDEAQRRESAKEELRQFFSIAPDILCKLDANGYFRQVNTACERILGFSSSVLQEKTFLDLVHTQDRPALEQSVKDIMSKRTRRVTREMRNVTADGDVRWIEWSFVAAEHEPGFYGYGRDVTSRKLLEQQLHHDAFYDRLTGVANRSLFLDRLSHVMERARRTRESYAVFIMDIDNFKSINDSYGHPVGDQLLKAFAERVVQQLRPADTCARFGGDEFTLLIEEAATIDAVSNLADRILGALASPFTLDGNHYHVGSSIGIALNRSTDSHESCEQILKHADVALYEAKRRGKGHFVVFDEQMQSALLNQVQMEMHLRQAIVKHDMSVFYQPIVALENDHIAGCEALVRWSHPVLGKIGPARFIPVAESSGLIAHLGRQVMENACRDLAQWQASGIVDSNFFVSVNLSPREFFRRDCIEFIEKSLARHNLNGENLRLEVTEGVLIERDEEASIIFNRLRKLGIRIYIDDFGTGYSSLSYLRSLPVDGIKLDRSFMKQFLSKAKSREIARTVLNLANVLELESVVEGVETAEQLTFIKGLGFGYAQGFGLHEPMAEPDMRLLLQGRHKVVRLPRSNL